MKAEAIDVDGHIDLVGLDQRSDPDDETLARARSNRLNDVMIVLERDSDALQAAVRARVSREVFPGGIDEFSMLLDGTAPTFHVSIAPTMSGDAPVSFSEQLADTLETVIAQEILASIQNRASSSGARRWSPQVTAVVRDRAPPRATATVRGPARSVWLKTLFWLLAAIVAGTAYLYLKGAPN